MLSELDDAFFRNLIAVLESKRLGDYGHREDVQPLGDLRHHGRCAGAGAAAHAGGDEHHVGAGQGLLDGIAILQCRGSPHLRVGAGAEALGRSGAELQGIRVQRLECLAVGVGGDELDAGHGVGDHALDGVAAAAADADYLDYRVLRGFCDQFEIV